ncbi:hypothetical protein H6A65_16420 [Mediterraneibacter glycyrrhizinilyticus]|uniref:hypothetical protein n=1 Tax=Mediterraneibacter glycyrrhizinilyticus TaxID=342942 RepID=UPI00195FD08D|nr:hypothetical protein [Mediterraneibacter glycyrrhizinilyticus]MBM6753046.1 hypothetical protein [Mediterraneibacter glycyrrhizinilyticus]
MKNIAKNTMIDSTENVINIEVEGLTEKEVGEVQKIFARFLKKYKENPERETVEWLSEQLKEELPEKNLEEIRSIAQEIKAAVEEYDRDLEDLNKSVKKGISKAAWLSEKIQDGAKGVAVNQYGDYLREIDHNFVNANAQMARTILRADGGISQNINLDGFMAEQYHVNNFNAKAVLENSPYRARVCVPENGQYGKNSVDVMIDDIKTGQKGVARYQFKYGQDIKSTINLLKDGNYDNQRIVVAGGQAEEVGKALPGKSVTDYIGGTDKIKVKSDPITKEQMKKMQADVQQNGELPKADWNSYQTRELVVNLGKQAGQAGIQAALLGVGISLAKKAFDGEKIETEDLVKTAISTGSDTCIKAAAGGALKVATEKGIISILPPGTPAGTIAKIACVAVENVKILWKVANGELTVSEAAEHMGRTSVSMYAGLSAGAVGAGVGAAALGFIPVVGPIIGGIVGGMLGYTAGNKVGKSIFELGKKVVKAGVKIVKEVAERPREVVPEAVGFLSARNKAMIISKNNRK